MTRVVSTAYALALAAVFALAGVTWAMSRGQAPAADVAVICSGVGVVAVMLDADGHPTGGLHPCPDCVAGCAAVPVGGASIVRGAEAGCSKVILPADRHTETRNLRPAQARAPPVLI